MTSPMASAVAFALAAGNPCDAHNLIAVDLPSEQTACGFLATVEPMEPNARGMDVAAMALEAMRGAFQDAAALSAKVALARAFAAANHVVREENRAGATAGLGRPVFVGATALALDGRGLIVAQVPPSQAVVVQEHQVYAFPSLASWCPHYVPESDRPTPEPLGHGETVEPDLYRTVIAPGDRLLLCASTIARCLANDTLEGNGISNGNGAAPGLDRLIGSGADGCLSRLEDVVLAHDLDDAHAAYIEIERVPGRAKLGAGDVITRLGDAWSSVTPRGPAFARPRLSGPMAAVGHRAGRLARPRASFAGLGVPLDGDEVGTPERPAGDADAGDRSPLPASNGSADFIDLTESLPPVLPEGVAVGPHVRRAQFLGRTQDAIVGVFERIGPRKRHEITRRKGHPLGVGMPGAHGVRCYKGAAAVSFDPGWRTYLPRGPVIRVPVKPLLLLLTLGIVISAVGYGIDRHRTSTAQIEAYLAAADARLETVSALEQSVEAEAQLALAQEALDNAARRGAAGDLLAGRQSALDEAHDQIRGVVRLSDFTRIGGLPSVLADKPVEIVRSGRGVFLVGGGFYQLDTTNNRLIQLLAPGQVVNGVTVGELRGAAVDPSGILVSDDAHVYRLSPSGDWTAFPFRSNNGHTSDNAAPTGAFDGSYYVLDPSIGQILRFPAARFDTAPEEWVIPSARGDLDTARDMVIDGQIHVLLADGRVHTYFRGDIATTLDLALSPAVADPIALAGGPDTSFLYVADAAGATGRIIRLDRDGEQVEQFLPPRNTDGDADVSPLADLRDFVVDESTSFIYFVTDDALWRATLPQPDAAA